MDFVKPSLRCLMLLSCLLAFRTATAQEIRVAAAADLKFALDELDIQFEKQTGKQIDISYGSGGNFLRETRRARPTPFCFAQRSSIPGKWIRQVMPARG